jgi:hypothetical protein
MSNEKEKPQAERWQAPDKKRGADENPDPLVLILVELRGIEPLAS